MRYSNDKNINQTVIQLVTMGWEVIPGKKHRFLKPPEGPKLAIPSTPSDKRAWYNFKQDVKKILNRGML